MRSFAEWCGGGDDAGMREKKAKSARRVPVGDNEPAEAVAVKWGGRPTEISPELVGRICAGLAGGTPISILCMEAGMPSMRTVRDWQESDEGFAEEVAMAREAGFDKIAMEALAIADDSSNDTIETRSGLAPNRDWLARAKMRVDTRLKLLAKWDMKRYGGKAGADARDGDGKEEMLGHGIGEDLQERILARTTEAARVAAEVRGPAVFRGEERGA